MLPKDVARCSIKVIHRNKVRLLSISSGIYIGQPTPIPRRLVPFILEKNQDGLNSVIQGLNEGGVIAVSDGLYKLGFGTAALVSSI